MIGLVSLQEEDKRPELSLCHMRIQQGAVICKPGSGPSLGSNQHLVLDILATRTVRNECIFLKLPVNGILLQYLELTNVYYNFVVSSTEERFLLWLILIYCCCKWYFIFALFYWVIADLRNAFNIVGWICSC